MINLKPKILILSSLFNARFFVPLPFFLQKIFRRTQIAVRYSTIFALIIILALGPLVYIRLRKPQNAEAAWFDDNWLYRKAINITNGSGSNLTDFQVSFTLDTATLITNGKLQSDCDDIRITDINGGLLDHWVEENNPGCNNASTKIWTKLPSLPTSDATIYIYYGNPSATNVQSGTKVFEFFDDFYGSSLNTSKWTATGGYSISGGAITVTTGAVYTKNTVVPSAVNYVYEYHNKWTTTSGSYSGLQIANAQGTSGSNSTSKALIYFMSPSGTGLTIQAWGADGTTASYNLVQGVTQYTATQDTYCVDGFSIDSSNVRYYNNRAQTNAYSGTWSYAPYLWLGYFSGSNAGTTDGKDITTDWVLVRKYASSTPSSSLGSEENAPGPVAYWKFDEGYGTIASDATSAKNHGTISSATWQPENMCISGKCLQFDGSDDSVSITKTVSGIKTVSFWVKPNTTTEYFLELNGSASIQASSGTISAPGFDNPTIYVNGNPSTSLRANEWQYVTVTTDTAISGSAINLGKISSNFLQGFLDEIKIYPYARSQAQILADYASRGSVHGVSAEIGGQDPQKSLSQGLVGYWKMDESSGNASDSSGNGNTGTVTGSDNYGAGKFGNGLRSGVATTNHIRNPSFENATDWWGWSQWSPETTNMYDDVTKTNSTEEYIFGSNSGKVVISNVDELTAQSYIIFYDSVSKTASQGQTWHFHSNVKVTSNSGTSGVRLTLTCRRDDGSWVNSSTTSSTTSSSWTKLSASATCNAGTTNVMGYYYVLLIDNGDSITFYTDGVQVEQDSSATPYVDGSLGTGYSWSGTAHASTSTRTASSVTATSNINDTSGTVSFWFKSPSLDSSSQCPFGSSDGDNTGGLFFALKSTGIYVEHDYATGVDVTPQYSSTISNNTLYRAVYTWDNSTRKGTLYVNGELIQSVDYSQAITIGAYLQKLGTCTKTNYTTFNGTVDDLRIYNRALAPSEVEGLYNWAPGPVGYWSFDDGSGSTANDRSGNSNTGTLGTGNSAPTWTTGKYGKALSFDGSNDYITMGNPISGILDFGTGDFTVSFWAKLGPNIGSDNIMAKRTGGWTDNTKKGFEILWNGTFTEVVLTDGTNGARSLGTSASVTQGIWTHVAYVFDRDGNLTAFVNGILKDTDSISSYNGDISNSEPFYIGSRDTGSGYNINGIIDHVLVYNYTRTAKQIIEDMNAGHPAVGSPIGSAMIHYEFNEGYGSTANNSGFGGNSLKGTISNGTWSNDGKFGKALTFASNTSVTTTITDPGYTNTLSLWLNPNTSIASKTLVTANKLTTNASSQPVYGNCTGTALSLDKWTHLLAVSNGSGSCKIYQNGVQTASSTTGVSFGTSVNIGASSYTGQIDEVKIYNFPLTEDEVKLEFNQGSALILGSMGTESDGSTASFADSRGYCPPGNTEGNCAEGLNPAPVGEWSFDEGSGGTVNDISGNGNTGTWYGTGATHWASGKIGKAGKFNGSDDYVGLGTWDLTGTPRTVSFWFNSTISPSLLSDKRPFSGNYYDVQFNGRSSNNLSVSIYDSAFNDLTYPLSNFNANTWYHISATSETNNLKLFVNGTLVATDTSFTLTSHPYNTNLGANYNGSNRFFNGLIDQVRIYNYARTPAQIAWDYNRGGPIAHYKLDECQGATVYDSSGNKNNGTLNLGASGQTSAGTCTENANTAWYNGKNGKYSSSLNFDGEDDYVTIPDTTNSPLDVGQPGMTLSAWIKPTTLTSGSHAIIGKNAPYILWINNTSGNYRVYSYLYKSSAWYGAFSASNSITIGSWQHVTVTYDGTSRKTYINGLQSGTTDTQISGNIDLTNSAVTIGQDYNTRFFDGQIDDVRIYGYALTQEQIKQLFNEGSAVRFGPVTGAPQP